MFIDLDVHPHSNRMAILQLLSNGSKNMVIYDISSKSMVSEVGPHFIPQGPRFSPDGHRISFFGDGNIYFHDVVMQSTATIKNTSDQHASFCEWSPDGNSLVYNAYPANNTDRKIPPNIYHIDLLRNSRHQVTDNDAVDRFPQWSPNGRLVVFHRQYLDSPNPLKQIIIADIQKGTEFIVPGDSGCSHESGRFCWSDDSNSFLIKEVQANGSVALKILRVEDMNLLWSITSPDIIGGAFRPGMNQVLCMFKHEIAVYSLNDQTAIHKISLIGYSPIMPTLRGPAWYVERERLFYIAHRGKQVHQWDYADDCPCIFQAEEWPRLNYRREKYTILSRDGKQVPVLRLIPDEPKHLAVEFIFGGPSAPIDEGNPIIRHLLHKGYEVICPVYRGQIGAGKEHQEANIGEMGRADVWDVMESGLDWKRRTGYLRPLALIGYSYGGLLTLLALADNATLWVTGITLWGVTDLDHLGFYKSRAYPSDPEQMETEKNRRSPLIQSSRIQSPLLMFHGGQDTTSTNEEVQKIQNLIRANGVPCELTIFHDDTHGLKRHRQEMFSQLFEYLQKYE